MATLALSQNTSKRAKIAAVSAVAASIAALGGAPQAYAEKLGANETFAESSVAAMSEACTQCGKISKLISNNAAEQQLFGAIKKLFIIVDNEHARLEAAAISAGARLLPLDRTDRVTGSGGKDDNDTWLNVTRATGSGGKEDNSSWLENGDVTGSGGKEDNKTWLSQPKISGPFSSR